MWQPLQKTTGHGSSKGLSFHLPPYWSPTAFPFLNLTLSLELIFHFYMFPSQILTVSKALLCSDVLSLFYLFKPVFLIDLFTYLGVI